VSVVQSMYKDATTVVRVNGRDAKAFGVRDQSIVHFVILLETLSREFWEGLPMELLYADDLV